MGCCVCVEEAEVRVIERFGKFNRVVPPGINCINCCTEESVGVLNLQIAQHELDIETRTKDNVFVTIKLAVRVKVAETEADFPKLRPPHKRGKKGKHDDSSDEESPEDEVLVVEKENYAANGQYDQNLLYRAYYKLEHPVRQIETFIEQYFRFHGMEYALDELYSAKESMTYALLNELNQKVNTFGYCVHDVLVKDIVPNKKVRDAMNEVVATEKEKIATVNRAEADKAAKILAAEAEARTRELEGEGIANARRAIINGLRQSVDDFQQAIPEAESRELLVTVLMTQYMDTIKDAASRGRNTFIMPSSPVQGSGGFEDQMRQALLTVETTTNNNSGGGAVSS